MIEKYLGKFAKKALIKETPRTILNPLGYKTTWAAGALAIGGVAAWGVAAGKAEGQRQAIASGAEYYGNAPSLDYDGVPNVDRMTGKRDFGATGNLVFGLDRANRKR